MRRITNAIALVLGALGAIVGTKRGVAQAREAARAQKPERPSLRTLIARQVWHTLVFLAVAGMVGVAVLVTGIVPNKASSGHWAITEAILAFATERTVATHSLGTKVPPLDDFALVLKGAGHFETGCRPCHGSPDVPQPRIADAMTPKAPYLPPELGKWDPAELFYIVKHGIKFTAMPAWPSLERDDEVWAMVAFLRAFPGMDARAYRRLVEGTTRDSPEPAPMADLLGLQKTPSAIDANCRRCHGVDGLGRGIGAFPRLAGQRAVYLEESLAAYARGERHSGIMEPIAAGLDPAEMQQIARWYATLPAPPLGMQLDAEAVKRGEVLARAGSPDHRVPSCVDCHGESARPRNEIYPRLAGQYPAYLELQLNLFQQDKRGGTPWQHVMDHAAGGLTKEQMRDLAQYFASLPPAR